MKFEKFVTPDELQMEIKSGSYGINEKERRIASQSDKQIEEDR